MKVVRALETHPKAIPWGIGIIMFCVVASHQTLQAYESWGIVLRRWKIYHEKLETL